MPVKTMKTHKALSFSCVLSLHVQTTECPSKGFQPVFFTFYFLSSENCKVKKNQIPHRSTLKSQGLVSRAFLFELRYLADDPIDVWCLVLADTHTCPVMEKDPLLTAGRPCGDSHLI